jgi:hypothetical protein
MRGARGVVLVGVLVLLAACSDSGGDERPTTTARESTSTTASAAVEDADLAFQPVLASGPCGSFGGVPDRRSELCYELGDPIPPEGMLEAAEAVLAPDGASVHLTLTTDGIARFNDLAATCFARAPSCPSGQVAVLSGGQVVSAPAVMAESFERDQIQLSGDWTRDEADALVAQILGG